MTHEYVESNVIPVWADSVSDEEAMVAFFKVARYWLDNGSANRIQHITEERPLGINDVVEEGLVFLWHFVIAETASDETARRNREQVNTDNVKDHGAGGPTE